MNDYQRTMQALAQGWNTWDNDSVFSHVLLPDCLRIRLGFIDASSGQHLREATIGQDGDGSPDVRVSARSLDGGYTELDLTWQSVRARVQSAAMDGQIVLLVTPLPGDGGSRLTVEVDYAWSAGGTVTRTAAGWLAENEGENGKASHRVHLPVDFGDFGDRRQNRACVSLVPEIKIPILVSVPEIPGIATQGVYWWTCPCRAGIPTALLPPKMERTWTAHDSSKNRSKSCARRWETRLPSTH
jgi:hypothetical protein